MPGRETPVSVLRQNRFPQAEHGGWKQRLTAISVRWPCPQLKPSHVLTRPLSKGFLRPILSIMQMGLKSKREEGGGNTFKLKVGSSSHCCPRCSSFSFLFILFFPRIGFPPSVFLGGGGAGQQSPLFNPVPGFPRRKLGSPETEGERGSERKGVWEKLGD